jgi:hypothetical protein
MNRHVDFKKCNDTLNQILDIRISVCPFVFHAQGTPMDSEMGWAGVLRSKSYVLNCKKKDRIIYNFLKIFFCNFEFHFIFKYWTVFKVIKVITKSY